jgi:hypothetical protein
MIGNSCGTHIICYRKYSPQAAYKNDFVEQKQSFHCLNFLENAGKPASLVPS